MTSERTLAMRLAVVLLLGAALITPVFAMAAEHRPVVKVEGDRVSLSGEGAALEQVLAALAEETGLTLELRGRLTEPWSRSLRDLSLAQTLNRLLGPGGHAYVLRSRKVAGRDDRQRVLTVISAAPTTVEPLAPAVVEANTTTDETDEAMLQDVQILLEGVLESNAEEEERAAALEALQEIEALTRTR